MKPLRTVLLVSLVFLITIPVVLAQVVPRDFYVEVSKGNVPGHSIARLSGVNFLVGVVYEDVITAGGLYVFPTTANQVNVSSTDVDDTNGGNGAWNVTIEGLDVNWVPINETITLNGQNNVTSTLSYIRINCFYVRSVGSTGVNEGTISAENNLYLAEIVPEHGEWKYAIYSVPANNSILPFSGFITSSEDKAVENELQIRLYGESWRTPVEIFSYRTNTVFNIRGFRLIPEESDIKVKAKVGLTTGEVGSTLNMLLISNDVLHNTTLSWSNGDPSEVIISQPVQVNIVESIDLMTAEFVVFTMIASILTYLGYTHRIPGDKMIRLATAFIFWIASLSQWISDGGGFVPMLALIAPTLMSLIWTVQAMGETTEQPTKRDIYSVYD